jgi:hypothetical protein
MLSAAAPRSISLLSTTNRTTVLDAVTFAAGVANTVFAAQH